MAALTANDYKEYVDMFLRDGLNLGAGDIEGQLKVLDPAVPVLFYELNYTFNFLELYTMLYDTIDSLTKVNSGGGQRGGASPSEMLTMLKNFLTGRPTPTPETYFNNLIWFFNKAPTTFKVVYDLLHNKLTKQPPPQTLYQRVYELGQRVVTSGTGAVAHTPSQRLYQRLYTASQGLEQAAAAARVNTWQMPLRAQIFFPPDRLSMILIMIKNIKPEEWVVIGTVGYTAGKFLAKMYVKLQEKIELGRADNLERVKTMIATNQVDAAAQQEVFLKMSIEFLNEYVEDIGSKNVLTVTEIDTSPEAAARAEQIMERVLTLDAEDNDDVVEQKGMTAAQLEQVFDDARAARVARDGARLAFKKTRSFDPDPESELPLQKKLAEAVEPGQQPGAAALGSQTGPFGGNRTMNRRKKSRRSKTIRKKRRLGKSIKKRKQFTKKRKARNKGKRKTRR